MRKRKMLLDALLLGIAIIAGSNGITVEAATKYDYLSVSFRINQG